jgi:hypothetical protein
LPSVGTTFAIWSSPVEPIRSPVRSVNKTKLPAEVGSMMDKKDLEEVFNLLHELQDAVEDSDETLFYEKMNDAVYLVGKNVKGSGIGD